MIMTNIVSASPPITISDGEIYALLDVICTTGQLEAAADYARQKLDHYRRLYPEIAHYDNDYLVLLTGDVLREQAAAAYTERRFKDGRRKGVHAIS